MHGGSIFLNYAVIPIGCGAPGAVLLFRLPQRCGVACDHLEGPCDGCVTNWSGGSNMYARQSWSARYTGGKEK
jgi:hypothetical protein